MREITLWGFKDDEKKPLEVGLYSFTTAEDPEASPPGVTIKVCPEEDEYNPLVVIDLMTAQARSLAHILLAMADDAERRERREQRRRLTE